MGFSEMLATSASLTPLYWLFPNLVVLRFFHPRSNSRSSGRMSAGGGYCCANDFATDSRIASFILGASAGQWRDKGCPVSFLSSCVMG